MYGDRCWRYSFFSLSQQVPEQVHDILCMLVPLLPSSTLLRVWFVASGYHLRHAMIDPLMGGVMYSGLVHSIFMWLFLFR